MFVSLGRFVARHWAWVMIGWVAVMLALYYVTPEFDSLARGGQFVFLPEDAPARVAQAKLDAAFPNDLLNSNIVIVVHREDRAEGLTDDDNRFISELLKPGLEQIAADTGGLARASRDTNGELSAPASPSIIAQILTASDRVMGPLLLSADRKASLVVVGLTSDFLDFRNWPVITRVEDLLDELRKSGQVPANLEMSLTGSATLGRDMSRAESQSAEATQFWTLLLVILLLVIIYRAPLLAIVPLVTLFVAVDISIRLLTFMAVAGWVGLFAGLQVYITVLVYGAGVDYCLFLTARYKEYLDAGASYEEALSHAVSKVGAPLVASAGTVICGIFMMTFAKFGKFHQAGIGISFSLLLVLCATLTFTPALLRMSGRWAFWPQVPHPEKATTPRWIQTVNRLLGESLFESMWYAIGRKLLARPGTIWFWSVASMVPFVVVAILFQNQLSYGLANELSESAPSRGGALALSAHFPAGITGTMTVLVQSNDDDFNSPDSAEKIGGLVDDLAERKAELHIADIRSVSDPLGITDAANAGFTKGSTAKAILERAAVRRRAMSSYVSDAPGFAGRLTRLDIITTQDPFSRAAMRNLDQIRATIQSHPYMRDKPVWILGTTANIHDLKAVADSDRFRVNSLVVVVVFLILLVLLRQFIISLYLMLSVLLSYLAALGATVVVFWMLDPQNFQGLDWTVPMFLFTVLVAVGEDYNIFLITRIEEEQAHHGPIQGITVALAKTGAIISSCGFIMAGTFSSLTAGSLARMHQLGFALAFGVLLDTFVVRPVLVPAFLILLYQGKLGPIGRFVTSHPHHALLAELDDDQTPQPATEGAAENAPSQPLP